MDNELHMRQNSSFLQAYFRVATTFVCGSVHQCGWYLNEASFCLWCRRNVAKIYPAVHQDFYKLTHYVVPYQSNKYCNACGICKTEDFTKYTQVNHNVAIACKVYFRLVRSNSRQ